MEQQKKEMINRYIVTFKNKIAPILKDDVSIKSSIYPYDKGTILVFSFEFNGSGNTEFKSESNTFDSAKNKLGFDVKDLEETSKVVFSGTRIIEVKPFDTSAWTTKASEKIIKHLMNELNHTPRKEMSK